MHPATRNWLILPRSDPESGQLRHDCPRQSRSNVSSLTCDFRPLTSATCILSSAFSILFSAFWSLHSLLTPITFLLFAALLGSCTHSTPPPPPPLVGLDTTDHSIVWEVDSVGDGNSSVLYDVAIINDTTVWAVGDLYLGDSSGQLDPERYNLAKWDGLSWRLERVYYPYQGSLYLSQLHTIWAFNVSNVWVGSNQPMHWNGSQWQKYDVPSTVFSAYIYKIWGTSSSNVIIVGTNGSIARFNGSTWQKMDSGTEVDLEDVWGIDEKHVWATGMRGDYSRSVILQHDGRQWSHIFDSYGKPRELDFRFQSVWTDNINIVYLAGLTGQHSFNIGTRSFRNFNIGQWASLRIRASAQNDIFIASYGSELLHYNGSTWRLYPEIKLLDDGYATEVGCDRGRVLHRFVWSPRSVAGIPVVKALKCGFSERW